MFLVLVIYGLFYSFVQLQWQIIILINFVEHSHSLFEFCVGLITRTHELSDGTGCRCEQSYSNDHDNEAKYALVAVFGRDVAVTHC